MHCCRLAAILAFSLCATGAIAKPLEQKLAVADFSSVVTTDVDVTLQVGPATSLVVTGEPEELARLEVVVKDGVLKLRPLKKRYFLGSWAPALRNVSARITTPLLVSAGISGSGDMTVKGINAKAFEIFISGDGHFTSADARAEKFDLSISGSGNIMLGKVRAEKFDLSISGSGDISLDGVCKTAKISISGSGTIRARSLTCSTVDIGIGGSGDIEAYASQSAETRISGGGDVVIFGNPPQRNKRIAGGGTVSYPVQ